MPRNVEIKAYVDDLEALKTKACELSNDGKGQIIETGFSYDLNINGLNATSGGTMEVSVKYQYLDSRRAGKVVCPSVNRAHSDRYENIWHKTIHRKHM